MFRVPEVEITRPYYDATDRIRAHYLTEAMINATYRVGGRLVYVDDIPSNLMGGRRIVWRFSFETTDEAKAFDTRFD